MRTPATNLPALVVAFIAGLGQARAAIFRCLATALLVACIPAHAAPVTVVATGTFSSYDDPDGLLPFPQPDESTPFVLAFAYESDSPDVNPDPKAGVYPGAISFISLSIGGTTLPSFPGTRLVMLDDTGNPDDGYSDVWLASSFNEEPVRSGFDLVLVNFGADALTSDALVPPSWPFPPWGFGLIDYFVEDRSSPDSGDWVTLASASARVTAITVVPVPGAIWLLGTGCLGLAGWGYRRSGAVRTGPATPRPYQQAT